MTGSKGNTSSRMIGWMAWVASARVIMMVLGLATVAVLARLLTPEDYGVFAAAMIFVGIATSGLVQGGFPMALIQRRELLDLHVRNAFTGALLSHGFVLALIWVGSSSIAEFFSMPALSDILKAMCLIVIVNPVLAISMAMLRREKKFRIVALAEIGSSIFSTTGVAIALAYAGFGVWALVIANIALAITRSTIMFWFARFNPLPIITSHMRDILSISMGFSVAGALAVLSDNGAKFIVGKALGADALGIFSRANRVVDIPLTLIGSSNVLFPVMSELNNDRTRMGRGYLRAIALCSLAAAPLMVLVYHGAEGLVLLLLGERWTLAIMPTAILSMTIVFGLNLKVANVVFMALGRVKETIIRQAVFAIAIVAGSIVGSQYGVSGVCVAVVLTYATCCLLCMHLSNRLLDVGWLDIARAVLPAILLALPVLGALILGESFIWGDVQKNLQFPLEAATVGLVGYAACLLKPSWFLGPDGIWLLSEVRRRMPPILRRLIPDMRA